MLREKVSLLILFSVLLGCSKASPGEDPANPTNSIPPAALLRGIDLDPTTIGSGSAHQKGSVSFNQNSVRVEAAGMVRFNDPWAGKETLVDLGVFSASDFGQKGSMTLDAETLNYPFSGGAYPVLTSFYVETASGEVEFVNTTEDCRTGAGMWNCSGTSCTANALCSVQGNTSFGGREDWDQHQVPPYGYSTTNTFPRCDASIGSWSGCTPALSRLPEGHYYAKYVLMSDQSGSVASASASLKVTVTLKKDTASPSDGNQALGAVDVNVILVGDKNINDSNTVMGARNLNLLLKEVNSILSENAKISLGAITVYRWTDANGGNQYSNVSISDLGKLFAAGSQGVDPLSAGKALNVFIVSDIAYPGANFTILGLSGGILGPTTNGTQTSGLAFSSFNRLSNDVDAFNQACTDLTCSRDLQDGDFLEMAATIAHEMGHYLGLNHPSEKGTPGTQQNDQLSDTPVCVSRPDALGGYTLDQMACYQDRTVQSTGKTCRSACMHEAGGDYTGNTAHGFCPTTPECQFNHVMWYTTKNRYQAGNGNPWHEDGNLVSAQSLVLLQWNPFVR